MKIGDANGAAIYHCDWRTLLNAVPECDALITDAPYSAKTHKGHDGALVQPLADDSARESISYPWWTSDDVRAFVEAWSPRTRGWFVSITDDQLAPEWSRALESAGRYVFAWLPFVAPGSRVRLLGDGPSAWTTWIVVARPRTKEMATWGTLPGAYVLPLGYGGALPVIGGKPIWLIDQLVKDYSRENDLCVDPCCGAGTLAVAASRNGRHAIVGDSNLAHATLAAEWIKTPWARAPHDSRPDDGPQRSLWSIR